MTDENDYGGKVALATLGCKVNQAESDGWARGFLAAGYQVVDFGQAADICVVNTCTVTHVADRKSRQIIRQARRANPQAMLVVAGCYADLNPAEVAQQDGVDLLVRTAEKGRLVEKVLARRGEKPRGVAPVPSRRTRAIVKVQDGCDRFCSYCIIPLARGPGRSVLPAEVVAEVQERVAAGHQEVVLTGVCLGSYGQDLPERTSLAALVATVLERTALPRLRLSSLEPEDFPLSMLKLWQDPRLCRHLHLPLQSGSDWVLERMGRGYTAEEYMRVVAAIRQVVPEIAITTDVMVGFPGETEREFRESCHLVEEMAFAGIHVFPYSRRPGTAAALMPQQVPTPLKGERSQTMWALARAAVQGYRRRFLGQTGEVLYQQRLPSGLWEGLTDNYLPVFTPSSEDLSNRLLPTRLVELGERGLQGELVTSPVGLARSGK